MELKLNKEIKIGYEAPKGRRLNSDFMDIGVDNMHYCASHDFWFSDEEQDMLLHQGKPCIYTDNRYVEGGQNFYGTGYMGRWRRSGLTLKAAIRRIKRTRGLPVGTIVRIGHNCFGRGKKSRKPFSLGFNFKIKKENVFNPNYQVNAKNYTDNFNTDDKSKKLINLLRENGFIVNVHSKNSNFLMSMIASAAAYTGKSTDDIDDEEEGEIAIAYGHSLRVGISSNKDSFRGYSNGCENILFDKWDEFDKWSRCREISKEKTNEEILNILLNEPE